MSSSSAVIVWGYKYASQSSQEFLKSSKTITLSTLIYTSVWPHRIKPSTLYSTGGNILKGFVESSPGENKKSEVKIKLANGIWKKTLANGGVYFVEKVIDNVTRIILRLLLLISWLFYLNNNSSFWWPRFLKTEEPLDHCLAFFISQAILFHWSTPISLKFPSRKPSSFDLKIKQGG